MVFADTCLALSICSSRKSLWIRVGLQGNVRCSRLLCLSVCVKCTFKPASKYPFSSQCFLFTNPRKCYPDTRWTFPPCLLFYYRLYGGRWIQFCQRLTYTSFLCTPSNTRAHTHRKRVVFLLCIYKWLTFIFSRKLHFQ